MTEYYTLSKLGKAWLDDQAKPPAKYSKVLAALAELITDSDVPRTPEQVTHLLRTPVDQTQAGLQYLTSQGYTAKARPPQPSSKGEVAKIKLRTIEQLAEAEARAQLAQQKYNRSDKGRLAHYKYEFSDRGQAKNAKYWSDPKKGRLVQKRYRLRIRLQQLQSHLDKHPELKDLIQPDIDKAQKELQSLPNGAKED